VLGSHQEVSAGDQELVISIFIDLLLILVIALPIVIRRIHSKVAA
jgi:hypothetical protein